MVKNCISILLLVIILCSVDMAHALALYIKNKTDTSFAPHGITYSLTLKRGDMIIQQIDNEFLAPGSQIPYQSKHSGHLSFHIPSANIHVEKDISDRANWAVVEVTKDRRGKLKAEVKG